MAKPQSDQRAGFLTVYAHPNIVAALVVALCAGGWKFVTDRLEADTRHDQQQAQMERRLELVEAELRAIAARKTTRE